ncbi:OPT/YSL family transporter [Virgibacillus sp. CBA3643]|uniref:OPT/YSL family transporter n=1 Tax=Virgibacillus sp. CBA3643 TaxID=2942278 RepID=UPI0035A288F1
MENKKSIDLKHQKHPTIKDPLILSAIVFLAVIGAIIGVQLITSLGISANTSIIGAVFAMILARIPLQQLVRFKSVHSQNLIQTSISAATFGAASSLILPIGIPYVLGMEHLIIPLFIGVVLAMYLDAYLLFKFFDTKVFPAKGTWPPGIATAEAIKAGDEGGKRAKHLLTGVGIGVLGSILKIPMSAFGVAFIGNIWALSMFGIGLLLSGYSPALFGVNLDDYYVAHGFMIGAGIIALIQVIYLIFEKKNNTDKDVDYAKTPKEIGKAFSQGFVAYVAITIIIALLGGLYTKMSLGMLIGFILFATLAAFAHELIVGIAAMHAGWFPAFAVALITLIIGIMIGFPVEALAMIAGFSACTGVAFADMGYDLKTGYILRGNGEDQKFEKEGRKHQMLAGVVGFTVAAVVVLFTFENYFSQGLIPPINHVYAASIEAGLSGDIATQLMIWAIPGALLQFIGGSGKQLGVLFSTGLLLVNPLAGWAVLVGIIIRLMVLKSNAAKYEQDMTIMAAGVIAGDAIYSFMSSIIKIGK